MIQQQTMLTISDNSGARRAMCIKVLGGTRRRYGTVGDIIVVAIKDALPGANVKKGEVARAVIVRTRKEIRRKLLIEEIDQAIVMAHHLKVPGPEFLQLIHERLDALEDRRRANEEAKEG